MPINAIREFLKFEAAGGIILVIAAILALILANSPLAWLYNDVLGTYVEVRIGELQIEKPLLLWINDGMMAVFFFLVGLEIKREVMEGELSSMSKASLPIIGAIGGMAVPALVYVAFNIGDPAAINGWAIPAATDIAFALGVLALLGSRVPTTLKVFLLALAIIDDLGAIVIIAIFYTADLSLLSLGLAAIGLVGLLILNLFGVRKIAPYILIGIFIWVCVLKSGVHATLAGVALAFFIPLRTDAQGHSPLRHLEHELHPWVAFGILPVFAFANAGVSFAGMGVGAVFEPVTLGILLGLFVGKQIGVFGFAYGAVRFGLAKMPEGTDWIGFYGVALLTGIGFTMSLFIGTLAFPPGSNEAAVRLGVLGGSLLSGVVGYLVLRFGLKERTVTSRASTAAAE
jgi:NhaA family Na+:H+ antiporter